MKLQKNIGLLILTSIALSACSNDTSTQDPQDKISSKNIAKENDELPSQEIIKEAPEAPVVENLDQSKIVEPTEPLTEVIDTLK